MVRDQRMTTEKKDTIELLFLQDQAGWRVRNSTE